MTGEIAMNEIKVEFKPTTVTALNGGTNSDEPLEIVVAVSSDGTKDQDHRKEKSANLSGCSEYRKRFINCCRNMTCNCNTCREQLREACTVEQVKKRFPIVDWLPKYRPRDLQCDLIAGLTVGLMVIPQGLAYAAIAELPPQYGLYSAFMGCFIYCIMGTSKDITLGPTAIMSLMTAAFALSPLKKDPTYAIILCLMTGCIQLLMGILHLGFLVRYISHPVISSFTSAAAITIAIGQLKNLLGLKKIPREFMHMVKELILHISQTKLWDMTMGIICIIILLCMKKLRDIKFNEENITVGKRVLKNVFWLLSIGRNALIVIIVSVLAFVLDLHNIKVLTLTGHLQAGLPPFSVPNFTVYNYTSKNVTLVASTADIFQHIGAGFAVVALLSLVETIAIGKAFARKNNYRIRPSQELVAIGIANILGSFVGSYPVTGSFSRTAVNSQSGVRTPLGGVFTGAIVLLALGLLTPAFAFIPKAGLAAVIITAVIQMIDFHICIKIWRVKKVDLIPWVVTFVLSFVLGIEYGILVGIGVSLLILLYPYGKFSVKKSDLNGVTVLQLEAGYYYPGVDHFNNRLNDALMSERSQQSEFAPSPMAIVIDCTHISGLDYTTVEAVSEMLDDCKTRKVTVVFAALEENLLAILEAQHISNLYSAPTVPEAYQLVNQLHDPEKTSINKDGNESESLLADNSVHDAGSSENVITRVGIPNDHSSV